MQVQLPGVDTEPSYAICIHAALFPLNGNTEVLIPSLDGVSNGSYFLQLMRIGVFFVLGSIAIYSN